MTVERYYKIVDDRGHSVSGLIPEDKIEKKLNQQEYMLLKFSEALNAINLLQIVNIEKEAYPYITVTCSKIIQAMRKLQTYLLLTRKEKSEHYERYGETNAFENKEDIA
tara:strand:- start:182 stop:508 length:327 start_codon:yes stop_codon:yes gene_type:complete